MNRSLPRLVFLGGALALIAPLARAQSPAGTSKITYTDPAASAAARADDLVQRLTLDEKIKLLGGTNFTTQPIERLGVPAFQMADASCGVRYQVPSPAYTASACLAASWDADLAQKVGVSLGRDCRARGVHYLLGPGVNLYRAPMAGRNFEYLGEDPVLAGQLAAAFIRGLQREGVAAVIKHYAANNQESNRHDISSDVDERTLRDLYLRTFQIALRDGQPKAVMNSYNPVNGVHASQNRWLLTEILKEEFGFRGLVMSDWNSCYDTLGMADAGLDLEMPVPKFYSAAKLQPLLADGRIKVETLDEKVRRQLRVAFEMGWFDRPQINPAISRDDAASYAVNVEEARGGITLLKNAGNLLPLDPARVRSIVVIGPNSDRPVIGGGGSADVSPSHAITVLAAVRRIVPAPAAVRGLYWGTQQIMPAEGEDALRAIREADAVIVAVGYYGNGENPDGRTEATEREGSERSYTLPKGQAALLLRLAKLNPRVVVVLNAGGSVETASWIERVPALLHAYYPGADGNVALAEIIFGRTNPSGKLAFSWEKRWEDSAAYGNYPEKANPKSNTYKEGMFLGYRWFDAMNREPLFPFGFGLSYTRFEASDLQAARGGADEVEISVAVRNAGERAGAQVVQVYAAPPAGPQPRPARELKAFAKVFLQPKETRKVVMKIKVADLTDWDSTAKKWTLVPGEYVFQAGDSSRDLPLHASLQL